MTFGDVQVNDLYADAPSLSRPRTNFSFATIAIHDPFGGR